MVNAGAITPHALAGQDGLSGADRLERVVAGLSAFAGRRMALEGHEVVLVDPESVLDDPDPGEGGRVLVVGRLDELAEARASRP